MVIEIEEIERPGTLYKRLHIYAFGASTQPSKNAPFYVLQSVPPHPMIQDSSWKTTTTYIPRTAQWIRGADFSVNHTEDRVAYETVRKNARMFILAKKRRCEGNVQLGWTSTLSPGSLRSPPSSRALQHV